MPTPDIITEASVFFDKIAEYLPKSLEREALGDSKIYKAFLAAYVEFRPFLLSQALTDREAEIVARIEGMSPDVGILAASGISSEARHHVNGYNSALKDIATKITNKEI